MVRFLHSSFRFGTNSHREVLEDKEMDRSALTYYLWYCTCTNSPPSLDEIDVRFFRAEMKNIDDYFVLVRTGVFGGNKMAKVEKNA